MTIYVVSLTFDFLNTDCWLHVFVRSRENIFDNSGNTLAQAPSNTIGAARYAPS